MALGRSYTIPCPTTFRDRVATLARRQGVSVADLVRAVQLLVPEGLLARIPDPGEPGATDRENVQLKTGPSKDRRMRRKPRLQVRLTGDHAVADIRRALRLALDLAEGGLSLRLEPTGTADLLALHQEEVERLKLTVQALAFEPLEADIRSRSEALYVLGFPPWATPDQRQLRARFRALATIYHPDNPTGDTIRMAQLNAAIAFLTRG
ncbi:MAG: J domain-containing protein [Alphaproteobacteria bacterium]|nr:J domain-containing protein [Alphaproteobacteria bacterium]